MALVIYWYDFICFAIVAGAILGSLWVLRRREGSGTCEDHSAYESLLVAQSDTEGFAGVTRLRAGHLSSTQLWTSCWRGLHPVWLLVSRTVSAVVMIGLLLWDVRRYDASIFVYYTEWTFTLVILYFALGIIASVHGCLMHSKRPWTENDENNGYLKSDLEGRNSTSTINLRTHKVRGTIKLQSHHEQDATEQRAGFWGYLMQTIFQTCAGAVILTDVVFWFVIVPFLSIQRFSLNLLMGCMHSFNLVFLLLDTALNSLPFPWFRLAYFVLWSCLYVIFQWIIHACGFTWWPYPFLELSIPWAPLWYFGLAVVHIPCYGLYALIVKIKNAVFSRLFPEAYIRC
ncbi:PREDICTED: uncharacterized protein LOC104607104 [Nelumbo nucifera]|uniref:Uncharacterized protein LOC104607104 n=2 Tax=Nelumbo nucifera TaxID=4432 RepID=A0A1U8AWD8_NELNU|nr:PREDICTED: uncharacterized protein LOC104607104 [Nelumbo nucifera]DAD38397.1 TPA_asm: hypothetical protein HUJ06_009038 [Nelumbo nucifera]